AGEPELLAKELQALLDDDTERARMGAAAWQRVQERFTWRAVAELTAERYISAIDTITGPSTHSTGRRSPSAPERARADTASPHRARSCPGSPGMSPCSPSVRAHAAGSWAGAGAATPTRSTVAVPTASPSTRTAMISPRSRRCWARC